MSASDVRRGPGWWMDLEGDWNPPETWPDDSPPLPGWRRNGEGRWEPPASADGSLREGTDDDAAEVVGLAAPDPEPARPRVNLTYADRSAAPSTPAVSSYRGPSIWSAIQAAVIAAVVAAMIAVGSIVLISLL